MKHVGTKFEFTDQRNANLIAVYRKKLSECKVIRLTDVLKDTVNNPSERFWVSEERATEVVLKMMRGDQLKKMSPNKREMFQEIFRRAMEAAKMNPRRNISLIVASIVDSPAPKFYLTPGSAKVIIHNATKGKR